MYVIVTVLAACLFSLLSFNSNSLFLIIQDALEAAMKGGLWGHALLLASKMDNRTHARVMIR